MRQIGIVILYAVMLVTFVYVATSVYSILTSLEVKADTGVLYPDLLRMIAALVFGIGAPYWVIYFLLKK